MNSASRDQKPPFQFSVRTMLIATAVLAAVLSLFKWLGAPTIFLVTIVAMLAIDLIMITLLLLADSARLRRGVRRNDPPSDDGNTL